jgi:chaperonin GroEL
LALAVACYGKSLDGIEQDNKDLSFGERIINRAILEPIKQISHNAGVDGSVILQRVIDANQGESVKGYNATTGEIVDLIDKGIIDPAKVSRCALENAASGAMMLLTTEVVIADMPEKNNNQMPKM